MEGQDAPPPQSAAGYEEIGPLGKIEPPPPPADPLNPGRGAPLRDDGVDLDELSGSSASERVKDTPLPPIAKRTKSQKPAEKGSSTQVQVGLRKSGMKSKESRKSQKKKMSNEKTQQTPPVAGCLSSTYGPVVKKQRSSCIYIGRAVGILLLLTSLATAGIALYLYLWAKRMSGMHFLVGISTKDYVIMAADKASFAYGAILADDDSDKEFRVGSKVTMMCIGEEGDVAQFGDWVKGNIRLYSIRNGYELAPKSTHHWIRHNIASNLRTADAYSVDSLIGGYDDYENKAFLGSVDHLGSGVSEQPYLFRGFPGRFCYAIMDREYSKDMPEEKGLDLLNKCIKEAKRRFVANLVGYKIVVIDKNGYRKLPDVNF